MSRPKRVPIWVHLRTTGHKGASYYYYIIPIYDYVHVLPITLIFYVFKNPTSAASNAWTSKNIWILLHIHLFNTQPTLAQFSFSHSVDSTSFYFYMNILHFASMWKYFRTTGIRGDAQSRPTTAVPAHFCCFCCSLYVLCSKAAFVYGERIDRPKHYDHSAICNRVFGRKGETLEKID